MNLLLSLLAGAAAAAGALAFPGMMNMSVVGKSLACGQRTARRFALGIAATILIQGAIGILGARFLGMNPQILETLKVWAGPIFVVLACFFVYRGIRRRQKTEKERRRERREGNHFAQGMSLAAMNMLAIPYYYLISTTFFVGPRAGVFGFKLLFLIGLGAVAYLLLSTYARYANWVDEKANLLTSNLNFIISGMLVVLAITQTVRVYKGG